MNKLECIGDNIMFELPDVAEKTKGGIIKPEEVIVQEAAKQEDLEIVKIISVGKNVKTVKIGDSIFLSSPRVAIYTFEGKRYGGIKEYDIFAKVI